MLRIELGDVNRCKFNEAGEQVIPFTIGPSLLPILSKVLENVIASQLKSYLKEHNLLPAEQFAYRDRHSAEDALVYTVNKLLHARDVGKTTGLVFVDLSKAFDRVQHQTLINELADIGLKDKALQWFISYFSDRSQQIRLAGSLSEETTCSRGVPQGSVLGPLLFTLHIRALPAKFRKSQNFVLANNSNNKVDTFLLACASTEKPERLGLARA